MRRRLVSLLALAAPAVACNFGTTGDQLLTFSAFASGVSDASQPFVFNGYSVQLTAVKMRIGAVYVDESPLGTQAESPICINPGVYAAQVPGPIEVDLLDDKPQEFSVYGNGTADLGQSWQLWLTDGDVNEANLTHMIDLQGTATREADQQAFPFAAVVTINQNRQIPDVNPSQPGNNPICKQRIIQIGGIDVVFFQGGVLDVTIDPRRWFELLTVLDFASLPLTTDENCTSVGDSLVTIDPFVDYGPPVCVATAPSGVCPGTSLLNPHACTTATLPCEVPKRCIPNTNFASGPGSLEGKEFFQGVLTGGGATTYTLSYTKAPR